jgi:hypothetical protein
VTDRSRWTWGTIATAVAVITGIVAFSVKGTAASGDDETESKIKRGFDIAPVQLNLTGKNRALVGMGSYLVNAVGDCNGCHSGPSGEYAAGGDPFQGQPTIVNQAAYFPKLDTRQDGSSGRGGDLPRVP